MPGRLFYASRVLGAALGVGGTGSARLASLAKLAVREGALKRFVLIVRHAMPVLLLTAWALLFIWYGGFRSAGPRSHLRRAAGLAMAVVFLALGSEPWRAFRAAPATGDVPGAAARAVAVRTLVAGNFALGLLTVPVAAGGRFGG